MAKSFPKRIFCFENLSLSAMIQLPVCDSALVLYKTLAAASD